MSILTVFLLTRGRGRGWRRPGAGEANYCLGPHGPGASALAYLVVRDFWGLLQSFNTLVAGCRCWGLVLIFVSVKPSGVLGNGHQVEGVPGVGHSEDGPLNGGDNRRLNNGWGRGRSCLGGEPVRGRPELGLEGDGEGDCDVEGERSVRGTPSDRSSGLRLRELCPGEGFLYPSGREGARPGRGRGVNGLFGGESMTCQF